MKAAARHPEGWRLLPKGRKKAERQVPSFMFNVPNNIELIHADSRLPSPRPYTGVGIVAILLC